ncbi:hypothetical protein KC365_g3960 [Hortaea werneckii]|nr:hypothetical protein KC365_g3960 [Hortaea werneckii]
MVLPVVHVPSEKTLCGGHAANALEPIDCPISEIGDIINSQAFTEFASHSSDDIYYNYPHVNCLSIIGTVPSQGLWRVFERHVFARWSAYDIGSCRTRNRDLDFFVGPSVESEGTATGDLGAFWYEILDTDLPYINFYGVTGTHLWLQVHDLRLVNNGPIYKGESLRDKWFNIYSKMKDGTAEAIPTDPTEAQVRREMAEEDCNIDDEEPAEPDPPEYQETDQQP